MNKKKKKTVFLKTEESKTVFKKTGDYPLSFIFSLFFILKR